MIAAVGVDALEIARLQRLWDRSGTRFLERVFTIAERDYCLGRGRPSESLAARFAAKEAVMKCLGTGWGQGVGFLQIEITRSADGPVGVQLHGAAAAIAQQRGFGRIHLSLTHTDSMAVAFAVAETA